MGSPDRYIAVNNKAGLPANHIMRKTAIIVILFLAYLPLTAQQLYPRKEYAATLLQLNDALLKRQITDPADADYGAIKCRHCNVLHTRAAEAVYPFSVGYAISGDSAFLRAAIRAGSWLLKQQEPDGSWKETPEEWTGTTTDQLLMLLLAFDKLSGGLDETAQHTWKRGMDKAAAYLMAVMKPEFASINYVATTTATLAEAGRFFNNEAYTSKARELARRTVSKIDEDGFLNGEGGRSYRNKMGVDLGYNMEMSLWGLGLYARITGDTLVDGYVKKALKNHLYFIYPDGSMDASWGIRSNKWTGYGSATSDGCQALFSMYADEDDRYTTASLRNLEFLRRNFAGDLIGYGLQHEELFTTPPCIYPSFAKAKNLALAYELETREIRPAKALPVDKAGWMKLFPTLDVVELRTKNFMATITAYRYKDPAGTKGKYMYRPAGGAISHSWLKGHGFLQAGSPTVYTRPEPMSFPEAPGVLPLTPRIEYTDSLGYFTNLFEFDGILSIAASKRNRYAVSVSGELRDKNFLTGGVGYKMSYMFTNSYFEKTIRLTCHDAWPDAIKIIEPFIDFKGMVFEKTDDRTVHITTGNKKLAFEIISGNARLIAGRNADKYWTPYPALKAFPIELEIAPAPPGYSQTITYRVSVVD